MTNEARKFYVTVVREATVGTFRDPLLADQAVVTPAKRGWIAGPFDTFEDAQARVIDAKRAASAIDPFTDFDLWGVSSITKPATALDWPQGVLNVKLGLTRAPAYDRPLAQHPLVSYRCRASSGKSWIMIGAKDNGDAMREAKRSDPKARRRDLEIWDETSRRYVAAMGRTDK